METNGTDIGKNRTFTLGEIVDYCKGAVEWDDVRGVVAMLNKLLRRTGTDGELDMVDSIEREFVRRRYGNVFPNAKVTMQSPHIHGALYDISGNENVNLGNTNG